MLRKTLTILSLLGLLLSVGLWGVSSFYATGILYLNANNWVRLYVGGLEYNYVYSDDPLLNPTPKFAYRDCKEWLKLEGCNNVLAWQSIGLLLAPHPKGATPILFGPQRSPQVSRAMLSQGVHIDGVFIPHWIPSGLFAAMLALCFLPLGRRRKRKMLGLCVKCGYDLRASKDRCPECGRGFEGVPKDPLKGSQNRSKSASCGDMR
ncbi:MAG: hypothetical protein O7D91_09345 [Planctomycetota bacterium]|nr:hypothetical protein [Planctomycetota bacterium]